MTEHEEGPRPGWVRLADVPSIPRASADSIPEEIRIVPLPEFTAVEEPGIEALLGSIDRNLIPVGGDVMLYGDGGAGKTTLAVDLAFHLASGLDWLGIPVESPRSVLLIENEGPRPLFRRKLRKRFAAWDGPPLEDRLHVWEDPWAGFSFTVLELRAQLAQVIFERQIDLVIAGPVTQLGMEDAGTIREVRAFAQHVALVRERSLRPVASMLVHHESKAGRVSGAWEGVGDTMLHVSGSGHGRTRVAIQKARWSPHHHATTLLLRWAEGASFELDEDDEDRPARVWDQVLAEVMANGGTGWVAVEKVVGGGKDYIRRRRDSAIEEGLLIDLGKGNPGAGHRYELWHRDDPSRPRQIGETERVGGANSPSANSPTRELAPDSPTPPTSQLLAGEGDSEGSRHPAPLRSRGRLTTDHSPGAPDQWVDPDEDIDW